MNDELSALFKACVEEFCFTLGLEHSFATLMRVVRNMIPATQISCGAYELGTDRHTLLVTLDESGTELPGHVYPPGFLDKLERYYGREVNGAFVCHVPDARERPDFWALYAPHDSCHRSLISLFLFRHENCNYYMGLRARDPHVFNQRHLRLFAYFREPISALMRELLINHADEGLSRCAALAEGDGYRAALGRCRGMAKALRQVDEVAPTQANVLIMGGTGAGKELVAAAIHENSTRAGRPFVKVNCGAIPESLLEAELFGYERGAFTGAVAAHQGFFEQAHGGTLYLDEIGELSPMAQVKLLRVLETHEIQRIGSPRRIVPDFRLISATNKDLKRTVEEGAFRIDLWYRLSAFVIVVPGLDRRKEDIPVLARYFLQQCSTSLGLSRVPEIRQDMMRGLIARSWPGNARELRNWMERALIHTHAQGSPVLLPPDEDEGWALDKRHGFVAPPGQGGGAQTLEEVNRACILWALDQAAGRIQGKAGAAEMLGLKASTLRARMRKLGIPFPAGAGGWGKTAARTGGRG